MYGLRRGSDGLERPHSKGVSSLAARSKIPATSVRFLAARAPCHVPSWLRRNARRPGLGKPGRACGVVALARRQKSIPVPLIDESRGFPQSAHPGVGQRVPGEEALMVGEEEDG